MNDARDPSRTVSAPVGYRLLTPGERILTGDLFLWSGEWFPTNKTDVCWDPFCHSPMARKLEYGGG